MHESASPVVEVCVEGLASALAADRGGADRVELCENLAVGGVTPSAGAIAVACERLSIPVHVLVRPRGVMTADLAEFAAMRHDIAVAREPGAAGVVLGLLDAAGAIERDRLAMLVDLARPMTVTFHKAFDCLAEPLAGLDTLIELGVDRVLTSGSGRSARHGLGTLAALVRHARGRIAVLPGGGITVRDLAPLAAAGVREVHTGSAVAQGAATDADLVAAFVAAAREAFAAPRRPATGPIWHLVPHAAWDEATRDDRPYRAESLTTEGFIHLSDPEHVAETANRYYTGCPDLMAVRVDPRRLTAPLVWELAPDRGASFPHLFGPIDRAAVVAVVAMPRSVDGRFIAPW